MKQIPSGLAPKFSNYSSRGGDFIESFAMDCTSDFGVMTPTRTIEVFNDTDDTDLQLPIAFAYYEQRYYAASDDFVYRTTGTGGDTTEMNDRWVKDTSSINAPDGELVEGYTDIALFNGSMYVSASTEVFKLNGPTWSKPVTTELTSLRPHLMCAFGSGGTERLYITDDYYKVHSINTSDVISATGTATLDLQLDDTWVITFLEPGLDEIWVGLLNTDSGKGMVYGWDGQTENVTNRQINLDAGVIAGTVMNNIPYIIDARGRLMAYSGSNFTEVDRIWTRDRFLLKDAGQNGNDRFVNVNGMVTTDTGRILIGVNNLTLADNNEVYDDTFPAGVYEYDPQTGLHCKYAINTGTDNGQRRLKNIGALLFSRSTRPTSDGNGTLLIGAEYEVDSTTSRFAIFHDDTTQTQQGRGYLITPKIFSGNVQEAWQSVYVTYERMREASDEIVVKYRTREKNSVSADCTWLNTTEFTTTDDVSEFEEGDEVTILAGPNAGHIFEIESVTASTSTYTIRVKENPDNITTAFAGRFTNFQTLRSADPTDNAQWKEFMMGVETKSPWIQFKLIAHLTGSGIYKMAVDSSTNI